MNIDYFESIYTSVKKDYENKKTYFNKNEQIFLNIINNYNDNQVFDTKYYNKMIKKKENYDKKYTMMKNKNNIFEKSNYSSRM